MNTAIQSDVTVGLRGPQFCMVDMASFTDDGWLEADPSDETAAPQEPADTSIETCRRRSARIDLGGTAVEAMVQAADGFRERVRIRVRDASRSGLAFAYHGPIAVGTTLVLALPQSTGRTLLCEATVRYSEPLPAGGYRIGASWLFPLCEAELDQLRLCDEG